MPEPKQCPGSSPILSAFLSMEADLRQYLLRFLVRKQDIEDVLQESFIRTLKATKTQTIQSPESFLFRVAKNLALSEVSRKSHQVMVHVDDFQELKVIDTKADVEQQIIRECQLASYARALQALPPQCRRVFVMCKVYGFSNKEIAKRLDISVSTVEKHLVKGLRRCQQFMQEEVQASGENEQMAQEGRG